MLLDFDHHATTPLDPRVLEAMLPYFGERSGNPSSSSHARGIAAAKVEETCRMQVADILGVEPREVIWTSGATESNNLALKGVLLGVGARSELLTAASEHRSVLDPVRRLVRQGHRCTILPVNPQGEIEIAALERAITPETALVSIMWANNEIGTIADLASIVAVCHRRGVRLHSDASQAVGKIAVNLRLTDIDLLSFSSHKISGPPGIGALIVRRRPDHPPLCPQIDGGGQQGGIRCGSLPLPLIVGLTRALEICEQEREIRGRTLASLRDRLWSELSTRVKDIVRHTPEKSVLPQNLCVGVRGVDGDALLAALQRSPLCVSSGAACSSANREPSHVLTAIGVPESLARASVRFGLGPEATEGTIAQAAEILEGIVSRLRNH